MKTPFILRSTHENIVNDYESKLKLKNQDITNLVNKDAKSNTELINRDAKIDKLEKEIKDLKFCLDACKKENDQVVKENIKVMRTLNMNRAFKKQLIDIVTSKSDVKFTKDNILDLVMLL